MIDDAQQSLEALAANAMKAEVSEAGPGDVQPSIETKRGPTAPGGNELVTLPMTQEEVGAWWGRIERARQRRKNREEKWDLLLDEYRPIVEKSGAPETVKINGHFRNLHSKIGQMFFRSPDLVLTAKDPSPAQNQMPNPMAAMTPPGMPPPPPLTMEDIIAVKQSVLMDKLGRNGVKANRLMDELLFDVLGWAGIGCSKLGYRCVMKTIQKPVMGPDPMATPAPMPPGAVLGLGAQAPPPPMVPQTGPDGQPMMQPEDVPVYEEYYWRRFSPKKWLCNDDLASDRYDEDSTWQGMEFFVSPKVAMLRFKLTEEEASKAAQDDRRHEYKEDSKGDGSKRPGLVHGIEIFCKASVFTDEVHPLAMNQLVLIEGITTKPVVWRPSPDQEFGADGKLTEDSLIGNPIRVLTVRDLADSPYPESDAAFTNSTIKQRNTFRRQSIKMRDAAIGKYFADQSAFDPEDIDNLKNGDVGDVIMVKESKLQNGADKIWVATAQIHSTADDYRTDGQLKQDNDEILGIGSVQAGTTEPTVHTATEIATVDSAVHGRNGKEMDRVVEFYLEGARMIDQLLMRYADQNEYIHVAGQDGAQRMMVWNNQLLSGRYIYDISPDSQLAPDNARDFPLLLNFYNLAAQDPLFNRQYVLRKLARMRGLDPAKVVLSSPVAQMLQPPHGGPGQAVNQHTASNSGNRPNEPGAPNAREQPK